MPRAVVLHVRWSEGSSDKYPSLVIPGYIYSAKGKPLTTITFENDNDVIVYAVEKIVLYARESQQIFVPQYVWLLASIIGLKQGLVSHIDNKQSRQKVSVIHEQVPDIGKCISPEPSDIQEDERQDQVLKECQELLTDSRRHRDIEKLKSSGKTRTGRINPESQLENP